MDLNFTRIGCFNDFFEKLKLGGRIYWENVWSLQDESVESGETFMNLEVVPAETYAWSSTSTVIFRW